MKLPQAVKQLIDQLSDLPSVGPRQATRLAFFLVSEGRDKIPGLAQAVDALARVKICEQCFFIHQNAGSLCDICADPNRDKALLLVIEKETDLISLENTGRYHGHYFLVGAIARNGMLEDWQKLRIQNLKDHIAGTLDGQAREIILGFNPSATGDFHAAIIAKELQPFAGKISRLGRGLPTGGEIEFADDETLGSSLDRRS